MNCPKCESPSPHLHPAVQHEGEIEICTDNFHLTDTPQNIYRSQVLEKREAAMKAAGVLNE